MPQNKIEGRHRRKGDVTADCSEKLTTKVLQLASHTVLENEWRSQSERPIDDEILQSIKEIFGDTVQNMKLIRLGI